MFRIVNSLRESSLSIIQSIIIFNFSNTENEKGLDNTKNTAPKIDITNDFENISFPNNFKAPKIEMKGDNRARNFRGGIDGDEIEDKNRDNKGKYKNSERRESSFEKNDSFSNFNDFFEQR